MITLSVVAAESIIRAICARLQPPADTVGGALAVETRRRRRSEDADVQKTRVAAIYIYITRMCVCVYRGREEKGKFINYSSSYIYVRAGNRGWWGLGVMHVMCGEGEKVKKKNSLAKETAESRVFSPSFLYTYIFIFAFSSVLAGLFIYRHRRRRTFHAHGVSAILKTGRSPIGVSRIPRAATRHTADGTAIEYFMLARAAGPPPPLHSPPQLQSARLTTTAAVVIVVVRDVYSVYIASVAATT